MVSNGVNNEIVRFKLCFWFLTLLMIKHVEPPSFKHNMRVKSS